ncbi:MAG TPA: hypothetical protein VMZ31_17720 [Phycisphaerae bacterium]|nr:hypothetical protein [Phycisphaerae bacterium]
MLSRCLRRWHLIGLLALLAAPIACQDALNPQFLAAVGQSQSSLPQPGSSVVLLFVNETVWTAEVELTMVPRTTVPEDWTIGMASETYTPLVFECGVTQFTITGGTVYVIDDGQVTQEAVGFVPPSPLDEGEEFVCGAVIKIFVYLGVDDSGNPRWEISTETVLD